MLYSGQVNKRDDFFFIIEFPYLDSYTLGTVKLCEGVSPSSKCNVAEVNLFSVKLDLFTEPRQALLAPISGICSEISARRMAIWIYFSGFVMHMGSILVFGF